MSTEMNRRYTEQLLSINRTEESPWFKDWFNSSYYHKLYSNRNEDEAANFIDVLLQQLRPMKGARILDLGCGAGRHSKYLASKGYQVTGVDLAASSIAMAKRYEDETLRFHQHDMRVAFGRDHFDFVFNFFTSFGYFDDDTENASVIRNISNSLKPDGIVMIDYLNVYHAEKRHVACEQKEIDGTVYEISRWMSESHFYKQIEIRDANQNPIGTHTEKVAKLILGDFNLLFERYGLNLLNVYGDYNLNPFEADHSARLIMVATKH